jgi:glycosyltransferase involved in cell wall biosynthesis
VSARGELAPCAAPLAILIPTFSRARHVERLLLALAADPDVIARRIPVLVADNDSSDDTAATVRRLMVQLPELDLRLHVQPQNLGMIGNLRWLLDHAPPAE